MSRNIGLLKSKLKHVTYLFYQVCNEINVFPYFVGIFEDIFQNEFLFFFQLLENDCDKLVGEHVAMVHKDLL